MRTTSRTKPLIVIVGILLAICAPSILRAQPFTNGSFELPALAAGAGQDLAPGSTAVNGWLVGGAVVRLQNGPAGGVNPVDGVQYLDFNGGNASPGANISQTFSTTVGQSYAVNFNVGRTGGGGGTMSLLAEARSSGGTLLGSLTGVAPGSPGYGSAQTFSFTATTTNSTLTFTDTSLATIAVDVLLDNVSVNPVSQCLSPPSGLVNWWQGEGNANDSADGANGTLQNGATFAAGEVGQAFSFDGVDDYVSFGNTAGNFGTNDFSIEFWIKTTAATYASVIEKWPVCDVSSFWEIRMRGAGPWGAAGRLEMAMMSDAAGHDVNSIFCVRAINDGVFHHVAVVRQATNLSFYIDGTFDVQGSTAGITTLNNAANLTAGRSVCVGSDGTSPFTGQMDEISIYSRALTAGEVQSIYNAGSAGKCLPVSPPVVGPFTNGSFEIPSLANQNLPSGSTLLTGWTVGSSGIVALGHGPAFGVSPVDGVQQISFNGGNGPVGGAISQTFSTTVGQTYAVSFNVGRTGGGSGTMSLLAESRDSSGALLGSLTGVAPGSPGYGAAQTFSFTATTTNSALTFTDTSSATVSVDLLLDNVSVTAGSPPPPPPPVGPFTNGSFELPALAAGTGQDLGPGSTVISGWTVGGAVVRLQNGPALGVNPIDGAQYIGFNGGDGPVGGSISQMFSTVVGQSYAVSFNVGRIGSGGGTMSALAEARSSGGTLLGSLTGVAPGSPGYGPAQTFSFTATTTNSTLTLTDTSSATVSVDLLLDNVSVMPGSPPPPPVGPFTNGSFELPVVSSGGHALPSGSTNITGWLLGGPGTVSFINGPAGGVVNPVDGAQQLDFDSGDTPPGATLSQTFATSIGQAYTVGFYVGRFGPGGATMSLLAEAKSSTGGVLGSLTAVAPNTQSYGSLQTFTFTAATTNSTLIFTDTSSATVGVDVLLDNVSVTPALPTCVPPPSGLTHWWPAEGNANDAADGANGTLQNGATFAAGEVGQAFSFDGVNDSVSFGNTAGNFDTNDFTIDFWIRTTAARIESIIEKWPTCGVSSMWTIRIGGNVTGHLESEMFSDGSGNNANVIVSGRNVNDGVFHHVAYVRKGTNLAFYIDGTLDVSNNSVGITRINNSANLTAGRSVCVGVDGTSPFTGQLDEISIYSRALTLGEIQSIYNAASAGKCPAPPPPPACVPPPSGLVNWWQGEGNANDSAGGANGTLQNGASFAPGKVGQAFSFDGVNDYISFGNTVGNFGTNDFTIEYWLKTSTTRIEPVIGKWGNCGLSSFFDMRLSGGKLQLEMASDASGNNVNSRPSNRSVNDGVFHHIAVVRHTTTITMYIDGVLDYTNSTPGITIINNSADFLAGSGPCVGVDGTQPYTGLLDELSIYSRALSVGEIQSIYNAASAGKCAMPPSITMQPVSQTVTEGQNATFMVTADGTPQLRYQWRFGVANIGGATNSSLTLSNAQFSNAGSYSVVVSNGFDSITSSNAMLTVNRVPVANPQSLAVNQDTLLPITLTGSDADGDALSYTVVGLPAHGQLTGTAPNLVYRPVTNYVGPDSFTFKVNDGLVDSPPATVNLSVLHVNHPPVAGSQSVSVNEGASVAITLVASDVDGDALTYTVLPPSQGTLSGTSPNLTYTPHTSYFGPDSFTFKVNDGHVDSAAAMVSINVISINDAPVARATVSPLAHFPGLTNLVVIAPNNTNATVVLDGSLSTDVENDVLHYSWLEGTNVLATGVLATNVLEVGTHTITLAVSDGLETGTNTLVVEVITPAQSVGILISMVNEAHLLRKNQRPLVAALKASAAAFDDGRFQAGKHRLEAFQDKVRARIVPLDQALADSLINAAQVIIDAVITSGSGGDNDEQ